MAFRIAPTDGIDLAGPHAVWQPPSVFSSEDFSGACGSETSLWVRELLPPRLTGILPRTGGADQRVNLALAAVNAKVKGLV